MLIIGLTGGIGSGKTTVANIFKEFGITIIDTDKIARELLQLDQVPCKKIIEHFGQEILSSDGTLNREKLREKIFQDPREKKWLENLLHPLIRIEMKKKAQKAKSAYVIIVIPLLFETSKNPLIDRILLVDTTEENQVRRTQQRDHLTTEEVNLILRSQATRKVKLAGADDVIFNNDRVENLIPQVQKLHQIYLMLASKNK